MAQQFVALFRIFIDFLPPSPLKLSAITCENPNKVKRQYGQLNSVAAEFSCSKCFRNRWEKRKITDSNTYINIYTNMHTKSQLQSKDFKEIRHVPTLS